MIESVSDLEGNNFLEKIQCRAEPVPRKKRFVLRTAFLCDGYSDKCLVTDTTKSVAPAAKVSSESFLAQAKTPTWRKRPASDILPENWKSKVTHVIGVDCGETYSGGFCCKQITQSSDSLSASAPPSSSTLLPRKFQVLGIKPHSVAITRSGSNSVKSLGSISIEIKLSFLSNILVLWRQKIWQTFLSPKSKVLLDRNVSQEIIQPVRL
jgi:hypothetical protein